ncbi:neutral/alkaline non-lysosomal ceramidase N-terminal domain-containing protein [Anatilimnocola sp. NA78]|uniref:neutral/alkaline non-lysosomal ceramidase N-terminal domain-containing protein n=1 Tax=Anatilimnocola sp. NA78 TaxID=3415683 RepID=UPI003CE51362
MKLAYLAAFLLSLVVALPMHAAELFQAGAAMSNITPPLGLEIVGGFVPYPAKHIHDELHARCLVLDDGQTKLAIVVCDLLGIHRAVSEEARKMIAEKSGITREQVLISATHTHSAASALGKNRLAHEQTLDEYQQFVAQRIADGVARALHNCRPAKIAFGKVEVPEHVFNRRWHMKPGTAPVNPFGMVEQVKMNPPGGSPNLIEPAGPTDPNISFISVCEPSGRPISVFATYSLHYVGGVGKDDISADYYGVCCEHLKQLLTAGEKREQAVDSPPFVALLANGTSGDINNINFVKPRASKKPYEQIRYVAEDVATKIHAALKDVKYQDHVSLGAVYREPTLKWRRPTEEEKKWATETIAAGPKSKSDLSFIYAERAMKLAEYPETTTVPLQLLRVGDVCLGTMPCEIFCEIGLEFKSRSPLPNSYLVSLAHGYFGYLPTPRQHRLGGYETWIGTNRLEPTASDKLLAQLLQMAAELQAKN